ncbi:MAG: hypothetical protein FWG97_05220 [Deltaproteobacteria bacterium]|nr:hypothetical protein [Deltaproteobacteria bacterium]
MTDQEYLKAAAEAVEKQVLENPGLGIPVDPDVAEFMGCFEEEAVTLDDFEDDFYDFDQDGEAEG